MLTPQAVWRTNRPFRQQSHCSFFQIGAIGGSCPPPRLPRVLFFFKHLTWIKLWYTPLTPSFWNAPRWFRWLINYYPKLFTESLQQSCRSELLLSFVLKAAPCFKKPWVSIMLFMAALTSHDWCNWRSCGFILQKMWLTTVWGEIQHPCQALFLCWRKKKVKYSKKKSKK